jgi:hypothetical protein
MGRSARRSRQPSPCALTHLEPDERRCVRDAGPLLEELAGQLARDWLAQAV